AGEFDQVIGHSGHSRQNSDYLVASPLSSQDTPSHLQDAFRSSDGCSAVLLHDQTHFAFSRIDRIAVLSAGAEIGFTRSFSTAAVSFKPCPVSVQTITASSGIFGTGHGAPAV